MQKPSNHYGILSANGNVIFSLETVKGDLKALDTKVEQLDKRLGNQEFLNRGIFIGLLLALLSGLINYFGWMTKG